MMTGRNSKPLQGRGVIKGAADPTVVRHLLNEVELSITSKCSLACDHCGFMVPEQPIPFSDPVALISDLLEQLQRLAFDIGSLAIMGGEATLNSSRLTQIIAVTSSSKNVKRVELVTNGLTPSGLDLEALKGIHRISMSNYTGDDVLPSAWRAWLSVQAPHIEFLTREHTKWDRWHDVVDLGKDGGQAAYDTCWYRRHCITLERGRIFVCSRIPKLGLDDQGLPLNAATTQQNVLDYLHAAQAPSACHTCTPMAGLQPVVPGIQPDDRIQRLRKRALHWFESQQSS